MKVTGAEIFLTKVPTVRPHVMAIGTTRVQESVFLRLHTDEGISGWGEAPHMVGHSHAGETQGTVSLQLREVLVPALIGHDPFAIEAGQQLMDRTLPRNPRAKSAVNIAMFDIVGKALGVPVHQLLGGVVRKRVPLSWSLGAMPTELMCSEAETMVGRGFRILKLKMGARDDPRQDVADFRAVRAAIGADVRLRADANQGYSVPEAIRVISELESVGLEFMEQPVSARDLDGMATVTNRVLTDVMADESVHDPVEAFQVARSRAATMLSVYINTGGGILAAKRIAAIAEASDLRCYVGGALEGPIAARACLHFAASTPCVSLGCEQYGQFLLETDLAQEQIQFDQGDLLVPDSPGLGGDLDVAKLRRYQIARFDVSES